MIWPYLLKNVTLQYSQTNVGDQPMTLILGLNYITLRRDVMPGWDLGRTFSMQVCINDAKHWSAACGSLDVTFTGRQLVPLSSSKILTGSAVFSSNRIKYFPQACQIYRICYEVIVEIKFY